MGRAAWKLSDYSWHPKWIYYSYDLQGDVTQKEYADLDPNNPTPLYTNYSYDQAGRLDNVATTASTATQEANYSYIASGKVSQLKLGPSPLATVNYHYNQRGWMTSDSSTDFWEHLGYQNISEIGQKLSDSAQYNGNISWESCYMQGMTYTDPVTGDTTSTIGYAYWYDNSNRLLQGLFGYKYGGNWSGVDDTYSAKMINYDNDGNLLSLWRYGSGTSLTDELLYNYRPNTDLDTLVTNVIGQGATYTYDSNGNIQSDSKDGIGFAVYDPDNRPVKVWMTNGTVVQYGYDVDGYRTEKIVNSTYTLYFRGKDERTQAINLEPYSTDVVYNVWAGADNIGQVKCSSGSYSYYYYLKDHLGDVRMILDHNGTPQVWNNYYPFGEEMPGLNTVNAGPDDRYQFTSKELDPTTSLYYFGARYYSAWAGRWMSVDPLAKKYPGWSPYDYVRDNPAILIDQTGMDPGNNKQGNQPTSNWNWQFGINGINWFKTGSQNQPQTEAPPLSFQTSNPDVSSNGSHESAQAKEETKMLFSSIFKGTAAVADEVSTADNYAILLALPLGPEASGGAVVVGDVADWTSASAKIGLGFVNNKWQPAGEALTKALVNTATLRAFAVAEADAQLARNPFLKAEVKIAIDAMIH